MEKERPMNYEEELDKVLNEIKSLLIVKHHDYGVKNLLEDGEEGIVIRVKDKMNRVKTLLNSEAQVTDESRENTWTDTAGYAIQAVLMMRGALGDLEVSTEAKIRSSLLGLRCPICGRGLLIHDWIERVTIACVGCKISVEMPRDTAYFSDIRNQKLYDTFAPYVLGEACLSSTNTTNAKSGSVRI
jgi:hypothetical protein